MIRQLEEENSRLKGLVTSAPSTVTTTKPEAAALPVAANYATVRGGDTLAKIAKRHGTSPAALIQLNKLKNPSLIRPGDKLRLPGKRAATPSTKTAAGNHVVKTGETFYSIARDHGISTGDLQSANPAVKATALRPGQILQLAAPVSPAAPTTAAAPAPAAADAIPAVSAAAKAGSEQPAAGLLPLVAPQVAAKPTTPAPVESPSQTVSGTPRINTVFITQETDFSAFAAAHGTSTAKLNALNGLNLNPSAVLAKGSELYVPAQP